MAAEVLAITTCRVSSVEQLQNNSLNRQEQAVVAAAKELGAVIPSDGQWSGSVSSKAGTNINRKDLAEMLEYCRKHKAVKYLIVDEVDRFMRSVKELFYFEVEFEKLGVKVWYATQPDLNNDDHTAKLLKAIEVFKAEGTNVERQTKSIKGQTAALLTGRYPFAPKPGYKRGYERGIPEIHPTRGPALRKVLIDIASHRLTPAKGLVELNRSDFTKGHAPYKMDKFRNIVADPFYAGIVEINKQVNVRNENGLHEPLITKEQHLELLKIMSTKQKTQAGPNKSGNPEFPCNAITCCELCLDNKRCKYVGFNLTNGKPNSTTIYKRYRCRSCNRYITRDDLHNGVEQQFKNNPVTSVARDELLKALNVVWKRNEGQAEQEANRLKHQLEGVRQAIGQQVEAATDPANITIRTEILAAITKKKNDAEALEDKLEQLQRASDDDQERFLRYAYALIENIGPKFLDPSTSKENRVRCKQLIFPAGFYVDAKNKVYTPEKSILITLLPNKKSTEVLDFSHLVQQSC